MCERNVVAGPWTVVKSMQRLQSSGSDLPLLSPRVMIVNWFRVKGGLHKHRPSLPRRCVLQPIPSDSFIRPPVFFRALAFSVSLSLHSKLIQSLEYKTVLLKCTQLWRYAHNTAISQFLYSSKGSAVLGSDIPSIVIDTVNGLVKHSN